MLFMAEKLCSSEQTSLLPLTTQSYASSPCRCIKTICATSWGGGGVNSQRSTLGKGTFVSLLESKPPRCVRVYSSFWTQSALLLISFLFHHLHPILPSLPIYLDLWAFLWQKPCTERAAGPHACDSTLFHWWCTIQYDWTVRSLKSYEKVQQQFRLSCLKGKVFMYVWVCTGDLFYF